MRCYWKWSRDMISVVFMDHWKPVFSETVIELRWIKWITHTLTDKVMKLLERLLDFVIHEMVNMDEMQFSFVPGRGTTDAIFIVCQLQEKYIAAKKVLYFAFVDLEKAFDSVPRRVLWWGWGMGCACHAGHVLQCPESCAGPWSAQRGVWCRSWCASGFCP